MKNSWSLGIMSIGFLTIAAAPALGGDLITILMGVVLVALGFIRMKRRGR